MPVVFEMRRGGGVVAASAGEFLFFGLAPKADSLFYCSTQWLSMKWSLGRFVKGIREFRFVRARLSDNPRMRDNMQALTWLQDMVDLASTPSGRYDHTCANRRDSCATCKSLVPCVLFHPCRVFVTFACKSFVPCALSSFNGVGLRDLRAVCKS